MASDARLACGMTKLRGRGAVEWRLLNEHSSLVRLQVSYDVR
jgi:hypothetical protein